MAARQRASVVKSHALMRMPAEKMKARVQEYIASTRTRIELSCLQLPISSVLMRVAGEKSVIYICMIYMKIMMVMVIVVVVMMMMMICGGESGSHKLT